jgi:hypothetical protein
MAIQRNALVPPFPVKTPFNVPKVKGQQEEAGSGVSRPHIKFAQAVEAAVNAAPQIKDIPLTSTSPGQPGDESFDANWHYKCVGVNIWKRAALSSW